DRLHGGWVVAKHPPAQTLEPLEILPGGHPLPDEGSLRAGGRVLAALNDLGERDLLVCLISGGGSALLTAPHPPLSLSDLQALTEALLTVGATITEINVLRRHLDRVKGGGLARAAFPARTVSLILSDVVGDPLEAIASGPTAPDPSTRDEALAVLERYRLRERLPASVLATLEGAPETPKPEDPLFDRVQNLLIGSNALAARAARTQAQEEGFRASLLTTRLQGEASVVGGVLAAILRQMAESGEPLPRPACLIAGGETTVTVRGDGLGGRNQELALAAVSVLDGLRDVMLITLATDGEDGPTDAAGAVVTGETRARAAALGLDADDHLRRNDAYHFFAALDDLLKPGPTGTNVNDLSFLFTF
ncbi:MAG: glycerate kinase, partial [Anaerolineae bacterium]